MATSLLINFVLYDPQGTTHLIITVQDVNDNVPILSDGLYEGTVLEEQTIGTTVLVVRPTINLLLILIRAAAIDC